MVEEVAETEPTPVEEVVEEVVSLDGVRPALLVAEDQIDPVMQVHTHELRLQCEPVLAQQPETRMAQQQQKRKCHFGIASRSRVGRQRWQQLQ